MSRFNGNLGLDGFLLFPSGANNDMAIRAISTESETGQPASGQVRFLQVGNQEGYWYLQNHAAADLDDFDAGSFPSGQRIAVLDDISGASSLNDLSDVVLASISAGDHLVFNGSNWVNTSGTTAIVMDRVFDTTLTANQNSVTISGLNGDVSKRYFITAEFLDRSGNTTFTEYRLTFNDDHTVTNYGWSEITSNDAGLGADSNNDGDQDGIRIAFVNTDEAGSRDLAHASIEIFAKTGMSRVVQSSTTRPGANDSVSTEGISIVHGRWKDTSSNITEINITASTGGNDIGIGSRISLWEAKEVNVGGAGGDPATDHVDEREAAGNIIPDTHNTYDIGSDTKRWKNVYGVSGIFGTGTTEIGDGISINNNTDLHGIHIKQDSDSHALNIDSNGTGRAISIVADAANEAVIGLNGSSNAHGILINKTAGEGAALKIQFDSTSNTNYALRLNAADTVVPAIGVFVGAAAGIQIVGDTGHNNVLQEVDVANTSYTSNMIIWRPTRAQSSDFHYLRCDNINGGQVIMTIRGDGQIASDVGGVSTPADYAEYFESSDPSGIDSGYAVSINSSGLLELTASGAKPVGFVSAAPAYIADAAWSSWQGKYLKDDFGASILNEKNEPILSPSWNSGLQYEPREDRSEWITVGLLGKLWVRTHDETIVTGDYVAIGQSGMIVKATTEESQWLVVCSGIAFDSAKGYGTARILYHQ